VFIVALGNVSFASVESARHDFINGVHTARFRLFDAHDLWLKFHFRPLGQLDGFQRAKDALFKDGVNRFHSTVQTMSLFD
jgi:hypothetical protein